MAGVSVGANMACGAVTTECCCTCGGSSDECTASEEGCCDVVREMYCASGCGACVAAVKNCRAPGDKPMWSTGVAAGCPSLGLLPTTRTHTHTRPNQRVVPRVSLCIACSVRTRIESHRHLCGGVWLEVQSRRCRRCQSSQWQQRRQRLRRQQHRQRRPRWRVRRWPWWW